MSGWVVTNVFKFKSYRLYLRSRLEAMPSRGRGEIKRIASEARFDPSYLSQILKGSKNLKDEHAVIIARSLGLNAIETEYFVELVRLDGAASPEFKRFTETRIAELRKRAGETDAAVGERVPELSKRDEAMLFSNWHYDAVRLASSIKDLQTLDALSKRFSLPTSLVRQILDFLLRTGLCIEENGKVKIGRRHLQLSPDSSMIDRHLLNWRALASERVVRSTQDDFFYSMPTVISRELASEIRARLKKWLEELQPKIEGSRSEVLFCLNIDWFEF